MRGGHQLLSGPIQQPTVGRVRNGLGLYRGVDDHGGQTLAFEHAGGLRGLDAVFEQPLAAFFPDAPPPAHQARRVARQFMLEVALAAEVLPVRVLLPALDHLLIRQREGVLEVQQRGHQPRVQRRASRRALELRTPGLNKCRPLDQRRQLDQFMPLVDQVDQFHAEQVYVSSNVTGLRTHRSPRRNLQATEAYWRSILQFAPSAIARRAGAGAGFSVVQGGPVTRSIARCKRRTRPHADVKKAPSR